MIADIGPLLVRSRHVQLALNSLMAGAGLVHISHAHALAVPNVQRASCVVNVATRSAVHQFSNEGFRRMACECVSGDLQASQILGKRTYAAAELDAHGLILDAIEQGCDMTVWMRSALACPYEGNYIAPSRVADNTKALFDLGAAHVIWEEGAPGLSWRAFENLIKTSVALGVDLSRITVLFQENSHITTKLVQIAATAGINVAASCVNVQTRHGSYVSCDTALAALAESYGERCPTALIDDIEAFSELRVNTTMFMKDAAST
jgi:hypothetical protein